MKSQSKPQSQSKKPRGRPKKSIGPIETQNENVNLDLGKHSAMDETSPAPVAVPKRRGRKPKSVLAAVAAASALDAKEADETPTKTPEVTAAHDDNDTNKDKSEQKKSDEKSDANDANETNDANDASDANDSIEKTEKPPKLSLSERKLAKKAETEAIIASGGRGKRTPKPNPRYLDEPAALVSASKQQKDELDAAEHIHAAGEDGDDEMNQSSDERRHEGPLKKRMLQKVGIKSGPGRKPGKGTPGRKPGSGAAGYKRKLEVDIDIDDDHGRKLFLDAKRRFQNSPSGSDEDAQFKKSKSPITDVLAAKLRSKYPNDITVKRTITVENKVSPINRARLLEKAKISVEKDGTIIEVRKRKLTEDTETSEDDLGVVRGTSDQETSLQKNINRRKTQHTKILSDDKVVRTLPSSSSSLSAQFVRKPIGVITKQINKSPLAQNQLTHIRSTQGAARTYSILPQSRVISSGSNKPAILRQPPRILNSSLCKPTNKATVPSFVTKVVTKDDYEHDLNRKRNNNIISSRSKENNVTSYVYTEKDGKIIPKKTIVQQISPQQKQLIQQRKPVLPVVRTPATQQRIISEPVSMNIPNSRRIRKITCFETWYVIKMVDEQPRAEKSILSLSLMQIGNEIKKIELPSNEWTYKILLQPLPKQLLELRKTKANEKLTDTKPTVESKSENKNGAAKNENETNADKKSNDTEVAKDSKESKDAEKSDENKDAAKEETSSTKETESAETPQDEKKAEESAGDDKKDDKSEEKKSETGSPETESSETSKDEKSTEKDAAADTAATDDNDDQKAKESTKEETKTDAKDEPKSQDSTENDTSAKETEEKKSDDVVKAESKTQEAKKEEKIEEKPSESSKSNDMYTGEVHDPNINPDERHNYRPINIMFRRKCQNPHIRIQFDRTVILKNQTFYLNVDGKNVRLVASPQSIETFDDIRTLLQIVDHINLSNCCVEPISHIS